MRNKLKHKLVDEFDESTDEIDGDDTGERIGQLCRH